MAKMNLALPTDESLVQEAKHRRTGKVLDDKLERLKDQRGWREHRVATSDLALMRRDFATSFGSCSFEEPVAELTALGLLP